MARPTLFDRLGQFVQAVLIAYIAWKYYKKNVESKVCAVTDSNCADTYFSATYTESREKFLSRSRAIRGAKTYHLPIHETYGDALFTDITILNEESSSEHLLLHLSGVHGVEGYTGSGIQNHLLHQIESGAISLREESEGAEPPPIVVFVHAVNPFGFHTTRRQNEDNVDLNRNLKTEAQWTALRESGPNAFHYEECDGFFNPSFHIEAVSAFIVRVGIPAAARPYALNLFHNINYAMTWMRAAFYALTVGAKQMKSASIIGQMHDPEGCQYVGDGRRAESHQKLMAFLSSKFEEHSHWRQISKITVIDVHSGDAGYGVDKLLTADPENEMKLKRLFLDYDDKDLIQSLRSSEMANSPQFLDGIYDEANGFSFEYGAFMGAMVEREGVDVLAFAAEFGANHCVETVGMCWIMEHGYFREYEAAVKRGDLDEEVRGVMDDLVQRSKKWLRAVFYVEEPKWKKVVVQRGRRVFTQCLLR